jgi:replicative DNA helicase
VPAHGRIFGAVATLIARGETADPITLKAYFRDDADLVDVGGPGYLAELAAEVVSVAAAKDHGRAIHDLFLRRELTAVAEDAIALARNAEPNRPAAELIDLTSERLFDLAERNATGRVLVTASTMVEQTLARAEAAWKADGRVTDVTTGLADLDRVLGGLQPCHLVILGARPGMGKSALATNTIMLTAARSGAPVGMFSLEMPAREIGARHLAGITGIDVDRQQQGRLNAADFPTLVEAGKEVGGLPIVIDETGGLTVEDIRLGARRMRRRHHIRLLIIDHINLIVDSKDARRYGDTAIVTETTAALKALAKELEILVLALSQLNRAVEARDDKRDR